MESLTFKNNCIVDFTFYHGVETTSSTDSIVIKELSVVRTLDGNPQRQHWIFLPPYPESYLSTETRAKNEKLVKFHKHSWPEGDVSYEKLESILKKVTEPYNSVFSLGRERSLLLTEVIKKPVLNMETFYNMIQFGGRTGLLYTKRYSYASPCLRHCGPEEYNMCTKSRATYLGEIVKENINCIKNGFAQIERVVPDGFIEPAKKESEKRNVINVVRDGGGGGDSMPMPKRYKLDPVSESA
jgi:hypothetical protein